ncbi:molybdopterin converting factor subunit 1 [Aestuariirhabdus litorea]|uniref:Molybdopterin synthase sulfur carrier subunit n=1 Tax=Aestuariirhabdus litorea TaxID=2528527 RepID=A0A3P3VM59_9GAMM|nr:molybdopterin converting factor subunit 1 [Aestuariirhabdus litorea]RRJ83851.1 molybdopterin converting factor subunit 1 [Aestuariirhabdus litorea]RWW97074.1 molybdopterin converting factor subunit 1 [Endozoicomonadaceae bacterium GTF-13]
MIKVLFFARYAEELGLRELEWPLEGELRVAQLLEALQARGERWQAVLDNPNLIVSVNQEVVSAQAPLHSGDEVALFPPVTGG